MPIDVPYEDPQRLLENIAYEAMVKIFVGKEFYEIAVLDRKQLVNELAQKIQFKLDKMSSGLEIVSLNLNLKDIHPPISIASFFEKVVAAYQEKQMIINQAYAYQFKSLPQARSKAEKQIKEAESYVFDKIKKAEGEGKHFSLRLMAYNYFPSILNQWMYYEYIGQALQGKRKIIIDPAIGIPDLYFGIEDEFLNLRG